jgi:WD40 repeat protein
VFAIVAPLRVASPADEAARRVPDLRVREFALCPDGHSVAVRADAKVLLVDWPGGATRPPAITTGPVSELPPCAALALGFSSDGHFYAKTSQNGTIAILDAANGSTRKTLTGHLGTIGAVAFSPDGRWLASGGLDNDVRLWDVGTGTCVRTLTSPSHATFSIVWARMGAGLHRGRVTPCFGVGAAAARACASRVARQTNQPNSLRRAASRGRR